MVSYLGKSLTTKYFTAAVHNAKSCLLSNLVGIGKCGAWNVVLILADISHADSTEEPEQRNPFLKYLKPSNLGQELLHWSGHYLNEISFSQLILVGDFG